ncbi:NRDE family protein [Salinibaculum rarum]|uniref:NRDE family protein n=1 Tax=Salinibaculum rarum TaxID=3058903 RepID=UPI00265DDD7F|nr:NRDE family protein [Salinibaculum sp. KK48]
MCTITFAWQAFEDAPVVVAANRDEQDDRPSEPPARRDWERPVVAPRDSEAGGTWIGYNDAGVLVAITNRWLEESIAGDRSRGLLVRDALNHDSAEDAVRFVERELDRRSYQGFNLVVADASAALLVEWDGRRRISNFDPGVHVVVNVGADGNYVIPGHRTEVSEQQAANADAVRTALKPEPGEDSQAWLDRAATVISDHEYGVCVHGDGFGTRSSSLVRLCESETTYEFADGPPCETSFRPVEARL